jgi:hypothetical protein
MTDGAWVFPVGHYLGPFYPQRGAPLECHRVRIGHEVVKLFTDQEFAVWALAHGLPVASAGGPGQRWTRHAIADAGRGRGDADVSGVVVELLRDGSLVEVAGGTDAVEFARAHRFQSLLLGLGASAERPDLFHIGLTARPLATVDGLAFEFWQWAPLHDSVWHACRALGAVATASGGGGPGADTGAGAHLVDEVLERLHVLLANGCGYLDVVSATST